MSSRCCLFDGGRGEEESFRLLGDGDVAAEVDGSAVVSLGDGVLTARVESVEDRLVDGGARDLGVDAVTVLLVGGSVIFWLTGDGVRGVALLLVGG